MSGGLWLGGNELISVRLSVEILKASRDKSLTPVLQNAIQHMYISTVI